MAFVEDGVYIATAVAPETATVRPLLGKREKSKGFPVYADLGAKLLKPENPADKRRAHPDLTVAHVLSVCAGYAYADVDTVASMMTRMGLAGSRCVSISQVVDAMFIVSTAYVIQSYDGKVVLLAYRGTEPGNAISWLTDADVSPEKVELDLGGHRPYDLHAGFYRNVRATRFKVGEVLDRALRGRPIKTEPGRDRQDRVDPMEVLYVTGHSLGGAMAAIMGLMLQTDHPYRERFGARLHAVYTFGQPMVGLGELADAWSGSGRLNHEMIRYIYQRDPVPHLPPRDVGAFRHFGREYDFDGHRWRKARRPAAAMSSWLGIPWAMVAAVLRHFPLTRMLPAPYQLYDHAPQHYIVALTPPGITTEFGDHNYVRNGAPPDGGRQPGVRHAVAKR